MPVMAPSRSTGKGMSRWKPRCLTGTLPRNVLPGAAKVPLPVAAAPGTAGGATTAAGAENPGTGATLDGRDVKASTGRDDENCGASPGAGPEGVACSAV